MTVVAGEEVPHARRRLAGRLRAAVLGPRGGGTTRRRASDAFRLGSAVALVGVSVPVMRANANSAVELSIVRALHPPPAAISWLVTVLFWLGSAGVVALLAIVGLLVPRLTAARHIATAGVLTWVACLALGALLGSAAGRPPDSALARLNTGYPVTWLAVAVAVAATALPYLSRPVHRLVWFLVPLAVLAGVCGGAALPVNAISSMAWAGASRRPCTWSWAHHLGGAGIRLRPAAAARLGLSADRRRPRRAAIRAVRGARGVQCLQLAGRR